MVLGKRGGGRLRWQVLHHLCDEREITMPVAHTPAIHWFEDVVRMREILSEAGSWRKSAERYFEEVNSFCGWCEACRAWRTFDLPSTIDGGWRDLRESFVCQCGLNGRMRAALVLIDQLYEEYGSQSKMLMLERLTPLFAKLEERHPDVVGCEYFGECFASGESVLIGDINVRHESILALSQESGSLDMLFHADVLEHVPNYDKALIECARVLRPGGAMLFSVPFFDLDDHLVRCQVIDGEVIHHLPPAYHGNPVSADGSLVFTHFGWSLVDDLFSSGFDDVQIALVYDPLQGIISNNNPYPDGHMWQIFFKAVR